MVEEAEAFPPVLERPQARKIPARISPVSGFSLRNIFARSGCRSEAANTPLGSCGSFMAYRAAVQVGVHSVTTMGSCRYACGAALGQLQGKAVLLEGLRCLAHPPRAGLGADDLRPVRGWRRSAPRSVISTELGTARPWQRPCEAIESFAGWFPDSRLGPCLTTGQADISNAQSGTRSALPESPCSQEPSRPPLRSAPLRPWCPARTLSRACGQGAHPHRPRAFTSRFKASRDGLTGLRRL